MQLGKVRFNGQRRPETVDGGFIVLQFQAGGACQAVERQFVRPGLQQGTRLFQQCPVITGPV